MARQRRLTEILDEDGTLLVQTELLDGLICGIGDGLAIAGLGDT